MAGFRSKGRSKPKSKRKNLRSHDNLWHGTTSTARGRTNPGLKWIESPYPTEKGIFSADVGDRTYVIEHVEPRVWAAHWYYKSKKRGGGALGVFKSRAGAEGACSNEIVRHARTNPSGLKWRQTSYDEWTATKNGYKLRIDNHMGTYYLMYYEPGSKKAAWGGDYRSLAEAKSRAALIPQGG